MPELVGKPSKNQQAVLNWTVVALNVAPVVLQLIAGIKDLFKKEPKAPEVK